MKQNHYSTTWIRHISESLSVQYIPASKTVVGKEFEILIDFIGQKDCYEYLLLNALLPFDARHVLAMLDVILLNSQLTKFLTVEYVEWWSDIRKVLLMELVAVTKVLSIKIYYIDGVSITYGTPRKHIWSYAIGYTDNAHHHSPINCPCSHYPCCCLWMVITSEDT